MKKIAITLSLMMLGAKAVLAQGNFEFNNSGPYYVTIQDTSGVIDAGTAVRVGTTATAAGFPAAAGPGQVTFELFAAQSGTETLAQLLGTSITGNGLPSGTPANTFMVGTAANANSGL